MEVQACFQLIRKCIIVTVDVCWVVIEGSEEQGKE